MSDGVCANANAAIKASAFGREVLAMAANTLDVFSMTKAVSANAAIKASAFSMTNVLLLATLLAVILGTNRQIFEGLGKVTQALGDTMEAAGTLAGTGVNATVKVTNKALDVLSTALTAADELFFMAWTSGMCPLCARRASLRA